MSFKVLNKQILSEHIKRLDILAPEVAGCVEPGQFVSVCPEEGDERIPLSVIDADTAKGTIALIFQEVGYTTRKLGGISIGEAVFSILGPLGIPAKIDKGKAVICVATGMGVAKVLPICRAFKKQGNKTIGIVGASKKRTLMLEPQMRLACDKVFITTEDGSYERKGLATDVLKEIVEKYNDQERELIVCAIGSAEMMEEVCRFTKEHKIKTRVHLNPVMVDCMGMCGSCRVKVGGKIVLACVDGPEFNGHKVDFQDFKIRMKAFEEAGVCQTSLSNQKKSASETFTKFLVGILKK
ncbi:NADH-dependent reduced ferredoxin:NADP+ oxidoreductase subunit A [hydrothermal vent metagenome]|uniref:NADH-dependent reduced ferredoxin:NADP+ oxidoreductase subunit A n=1 Tax=hydrothermal vent metagenome TaxID=652676 RepID=A0A3B1CX26_9ZZZZ